MGLVCQCMCVEKCWERTLSICFLFNPNMSEQTDSFNETLVGGVSTHLKNISQTGSFPQVGGKENKLKLPHRTICIIPFLWYFCHLLAWNLKWLLKLPCFKRAHVHFVSRISMYLKLPQENPLFIAKSAHFQQIKLCSMFDYTPEN